MNARTLEHARAEIAVGRLWRAKEILAGSLAHADAYPECFAEYGRLLVRMQDLKLAGMHLAIAGVEPANDAEREAIALWTEAMRGREPAWISSSLPLRARFATLEAYPPPARETLTALGVTDAVLSKRRRLTAEAAQGNARTLAGTIAGILALALFVTGVVHGCQVAVRALARR